MAAGDLQPLLAAQGTAKTGKTLASLTALEQLGLIRQQSGRWQPVENPQKQDLASAPVLRRLHELADE